MKAKLLKENLALYF